MVKRRQPVKEIKIGSRTIGKDLPTYFIADIAANHDGDIERAKHLISLAAEAGADAAKFQHFKADKIVSEKGFSNLGTQLSHQSKWEKPVFEVYKDASLPYNWTSILKKECNKAKIDFFSSPYDFEAVDMLDPYVDVYKIGSGDINWNEMLEKIAGKGKPVILATGASEIGEVQKAIQTIQKENNQIILMQCNTNYTGSADNFNHTHLNVLKTYHTTFPDIILGLSDHTPGDTTVLGAVALGARVVEKHFTDDNSRKGPDHGFAMNPKSWEQMVRRTRELERSLGSCEKFVAKNEQDTVVLQRRCLRASRSLNPGDTITRDMIEVLRPAPERSISPCDISKIIGSKLTIKVSEGQEFLWTMFGDA
jgi:sialic acid synthase SpsE